MEDNRIQRLVIVGGGTAGWMTAASLSRHFNKTKIEITVVDSSKIGTIGVGEATIPTIRWFIKNLGLSSFDVLKYTQATCKLGIQFEDWHAKGDQFFHPFGLHGQMNDGIAFYHYWLKSRQMGDNTPIDEYSLACMLAQQNKFSQPIESPQSQLDVFEWALHFDASKFSELLKNYSVDLGVRHIDDEVLHATLSDHNGFIDSISLKSGQELHADFFIDCTGSKGTLIGDALGVAYDDWGHWLLCDRAYAVQSESGSGAIKPYTRAIAREAGWQWQIPLQNRVGNGLVYSSRFLDDAAAVDTLTKNLPGLLLEEPRPFHFVPGRRVQPWSKNCLAIGLSAGFFEPIESTSIAMIETAIERFKQLFPMKSCSQSVADEYNKLAKVESEQVRDFIILHYVGSLRPEPFWEYYRSIEIPDSLSHKLSLFSEQGFLTKQRQDIFQNPSWISILAGMGFYPNAYDIKVDDIPGEALAKGLTEMKRSILNTVAKVNSHSVFLDKLRATNSTKERFST